MKPSIECFALIKKWEGLHRLRTDGLIEAYPDPIGIWTIGYGSIINLDESRPVRQGDVITEATALRWLQAEVEEKASRVEQLCKVSLKQCMFDALVSFAYNVGTEEDGFKTSTLIRKLNQGDYEGAAQEFDRWINANGRPFQGLINRRNDEEALFRRDGFPAAISGTAPTENLDVAESPYQPAPLPLPISRTLREGDRGDDCYILNCALAGLGFLAMASQPNKFTSVTKDSLAFFQKQIGFLSNGVLDNDTKQAIESALDKARKERIQPPMCDRVSCRLTRTRNPAYEGLEWCQLDFIDPIGKSLASLRVVSGLKGVQNFELPETRVAGSGKPLPQGRYLIGDIDWAAGTDNYDASHDNQGIGPVWVPLTKQFIDDGNAFGFHADWNWIQSQTSPGSEGCICPSTIPDLKELVRLLRLYDPRELNVYWGL
ncbi:glycoside hydrolase family protein [Pseudanabaena sp. ABRG5-3]|uniref:glycoside hydrolase family protein n=1 Tax=Pseudanabaena sp. ABRG5-3 TaxID=685565 RepID=UPI000DC724B7|nr:glycoside hydrolase family protein [Pseudanabaena sp. ABRG5-3]BBC26068.1 lysozyme [Pseudanabaena sp. ABRG5-3]